MSLIITPKDRIYLHTITKTVISEEISVRGIDVLEVSAGTGRAATKFVAQQMQMVSLVPNVTLYWREHRKRLELGWCLCYILERRNSTTFTLTKRRDIFPIHQFRRITRQRKLLSWSPNLKFSGKYRIEELASSVIADTVILVEENIEKCKTYGHDVNFFDFWVVDDDLWYQLKTDACPAASSGYTADSRQHFDSANATRFVQIG